VCMKSQGEAVLHHWVCMKSQGEAVLHHIAATSGEAVLYHIAATSEQHSTCSTEHAASQQRNSALCSAIWFAFRCLRGHCKIVDGVRMHVGQLLLLPLGFTKQGQGGQSGQKAHRSKPHPG
jgi:hypothetical protein